MATRNLPERTAARDWPIALKLNVLLLLSASLLFGIMCIVLIQRMNHDFENDGPATMERLTQANIDMTPTATASRPT